MGKRGRLAIIAFAAAVLFGVPAVLLKQSTDAVEKKVREVRLLARTATVSEEAIFAAAHGDMTLMPDLGVDAFHLGLSRNGSKDWCLSVHVEERTVARDVRFFVNPDASLRPTERC